MAAAPFPALRFLRSRPRSASFSTRETSPMLRSSSSSAAARAFAPFGGGDVERAPDGGGDVERAPDGGGDVERAPDGGGVVAGRTPLAPVPAVGPANGADAAAIAAA